ncbi:MAG: NYN domain-containing protein [Calditrichia bacterium]
MTKTIFLIDGFNLYHSILEATHQKKGGSCKWLDIKSLCASYLHLIGNKSYIEDIFYFSAFAYHLADKYPHKIKNHKIFVKALKSTGIKPVMGRFKRKIILCPKCKSLIRKHEEKETDVAIAVKLIELGHLDLCDTIALVSGDTDLVPAVKTFKNLFPQKEIFFIFPFKRKNEDLESVSQNRSFSISLKQYRRHQFPNPIVLPNDKKIHKPVNW